MIRDHGGKCDLSVSRHENSGVTLGLRVPGFLEESWGTWKFLLVFPIDLKTGW